MSRVAHFPMVLVAGLDVRLDLEDEHLVPTRHCCPAPYREVGRARPEVVQVDRLAIHVVYRRHRSVVGVPVVGDRAKLEQVQRECGRVLGALRGAHVLYLDQIVVVAVLRSKCKHVVHPLSRLAAAIHRVVRRHRRRDDGRAAVVAAAVDDFVDQGAGATGHYSDAVLVR